MDNSGHLSRYRVEPGLPDGCAFALWHKAGMGWLESRKPNHTCCWASGSHLLWSRTGKSGGTAGASQAAVTKATLGGWGSAERGAGVDTCSVFVGPL